MTSKWFLRSAAALAAVAAVALAPPARADVVLTPGATAPLTAQGSIVGIGPLAPGSSTITNLASTGGSPVSANLNEAVYRDLGGGLGVAGGTIFAFQVTNTGTAAMANVAFTNYQGYATAVGTLTAAPPSFPGSNGSGTTGPATATRTLGAGNTVIFDFGPSGLAAGATSQVFFIRTDAPSFNSLGSGQTAAVGAGLGGDVWANLLSPTGTPVAVPEPGPAALAGAGGALFGLGAWLRRRTVS